MPNRYRYRVSIKSTLFIVSNEKVLTNSRRLLNKPFRPVILKNYYNN